MDVRRGFIELSPAKKRDGLDVKRANGCDGGDGRGPPYATRRHGMGERVGERALLMFFASLFAVAYGVNKHGWVMMISQYRRFPRGLIFELAGGSRRFFILSAIFRHMNGPKPLLSNCLIGPSLSLPNPSWNIHTSPVES